MNLLLYQNIDYYYLTKNSESTKFLFDIINNQSNVNQTEDEDLEEKISEIPEENNENENDNTNNRQNMNDLFEENNDFIMSEKDIKYAKNNKFDFDINNMHNPLLL